MKTTMEHKEYWFALLLNSSILGAGEMIQLVKCLLDRPEDRSLLSRTRVKNSEIR